MACLQYLELGDGRIKIPLAVQYVDHNTIQLDFKNPDDVVSWLKQLITTLDYVKAIDKNSGIKIDVNVSLPEFKTERAEIKNINSLSNVRAAIEYEIQRQKKEKPIRKETRTYDDISGKTIKMREKEQAEDFCHF